VTYGSGGSVVLRTRRTSRLERTQPYLHLRGVGGALSLKVAIRSASPVLWEDHSATDGSAGRVPGWTTGASAESAPSRHKEHPRPAGRATASRRSTRSGAERLAGAQRSRRIEGEARASQRSHTAPSKTSACDDRPTDPAGCARLPDGTPHPRRTTPCRAASLHARRPAADVSPASFGRARGGSALQDCLTSPFLIPPSCPVAGRSLRLSAEVAHSVESSSARSSATAVRAVRTAGELRVAPKRRARRLPSLAGPRVRYRNGRRLSGKVRRSGFAVDLHKRPALLRAWLRSDTRTGTPLACPGSAHRWRFQHRSGLIQQPRRRAAVRGRSPALSLRAKRDARCADRLKPRHKPP
jgi:hypothetical protein